MAVALKRRFCTRGRSSKNDLVDKTAAGATNACHNRCEIHPPPGVLLQLS
jgi:hypothetical protein